MKPSPKQPTLQRTPEALAKAFDEHLRNRTSRGPCSLGCESEHESVLVAHELKKLGWKAEASEALAGSFDELKGVFTVRVTGKRKVARNG